MKKILLLPIMASLLACSKSDDTQPSPTANPEPQASSLVGRWKLIHKSVQGHIEAPNWCEDQYNYYIFGADNGAIIGYFHSYTVGESNFCDQGTYEATYSIAGTVLTTQSSSGVRKYNIVSAN